MLPTRRRSAAFALLALAALGVGLATSPAAQEGDKGKGKSDKQLFQGKWDVIAAEKGGEKLPDEILQAIKLEVKGDKIIAMILGETKEGTFKLDPSKKPKAIDLTLEDKTVKGIYEFAKDTLKICAAGDENGARPKDFKGGEETLLFTFKRAEGAKKPPLEKKKAKTEEKAGAGSLAPGRAEEGETFAVATEFVAATAQQGALKTASANNLKIIGLALHNYADAHRGAFPPAAIYSKDGKPLLSWRVAILPYLDQGNLLKEFKLDEPWDSAHNKKLLEMMPKAYAPVGVDTKEPHSTFYRVFAGPGTIFEGTKGRRITTITDGLSHTILAIEAGKAVPWTKPEPLVYDAKKPLPKLGGLFKDGFTALMADGSVRFLRRDADPEILRLAITCADGQPLELDKITQ